MLNMAYVKDYWISDNCSNSKNPLSQVTFISLNLSLKSTKEKKEQVMKSSPGKEH